MDLTDLTDFFSVRTRVAGRFKTATNSTDLTDLTDSTDFFFVMVPGKLKGSKQL